jgi:hypothetical protein
VSGWSEGPGDREFVNAGPPFSRGRVGRSRVAALGILATLAGLGWVSHVLTADRDASDGRPPSLRAGLLTESTDRDPAAMVVPISNRSADTITVHDLSPVGWRAYGDQVILPPHSRVAVAISLSLQCGRMPPPTDRVTLSAVGSTGVSRQRTLRMPGVPSALQVLRSRLCLLPPGRDLPRRLLVGLWQVEDGRGFGGSTVSFGRDGRFVMGLPSLVPEVTGTFSWQGRWVRITTRGGLICGPGDDILWQVGLLPDGRLRIGHVAYYRVGQGAHYDDRCRVDEREVWVARRL